jgi:hypothetical protein
LELIRKLLAQSEVSYFQNIFYEHSVYEFSLQRSVLICTSYSLNELHSRYNEHLTFVRCIFFFFCEGGEIHTQHLGRWGETDTPPTCPVCPRPSSWSCVMRCALEAYVSFVNICVIITVELTNVPGSNLGRDTNYCDGRFWWFSSVSSHTCRNVTIHYSLSSPPATW